MVTPACQSPAAKAGLLKEGDEIVQLNEQQIVCTMRGL